MQMLDIVPLKNILNSNLISLLRSADKVGRPFCCCIVFPLKNSYFFFIIFILFLSQYLHSAISLPFVIGSLSYMASW